MAGKLAGFRGFDWDKGNVGKNEQKHGITDREAEEIFFGHHHRIAPSDKKMVEFRYVILGKTFGGRLLTVIFTIRKDKIRAISARPMSKKERQVYEKES